MAKEFREEENIAMTVTKISSFDVFDTTLCRSFFCPPDVFDYQAELLSSEGISVGRSFRELRQKAEKDAIARSGLEDVNLSEIYNVLARELSWTSAEVSRAMDIEKEIESCVLHGVGKTKEMIGAARSRGKRIIFCSDNYLDSEFVSSNLIREGVSEEFEPIFISSECRKTKRHGTMFKYVQDVLGTNGKEIEHFGDNFYNDYKMAKKKGVKAFLCTNTAPSVYESSIYKTVPRDTVVSALAGAARAARLSEHHHNAHDESVWRVATNVAGPILISFVAWVLQNAKTSQLKQLFFVSRDGQILVEIAKLLCSVDRLDIQCIYLHGSRRAFYLPSIRPTCLHPPDWIKDEAEEKSFVSIATSLGLFDHAHWATKMGVSDPDIPLGIGAGSVIDSLFYDKTAREKIQAEADRRRKLLLDYLVQKGLGQNAEVGFVDLGWKGRLQRSLESVCQTDLRTNNVKINGFYYALTKSAAVNAKQFVRFEQVKMPIMLESFCAADHGSVMEYVRNDDGSVAPLIGDDEDVKFWRTWGVCLLQEGVLKFAKIFSKTLAAKPGGLVENVEAMRRSQLRVLYRFLDRPVVDDALVFGAIRHADSQLHDDPCEIAPQLSILNLIRAILPGGRRVNRNVWIIGSVYRSVPQPIIRESLLRAVDLRNWAITKLARRG